MSGARSIYEHYQGQPNANDVAVRWKSKGFRGCWVLALGTNEAADVAAGSSVGYDERIRIMMSTDRQPAGAVGQRQVAAALTAPTRRRT